MHGQVLHTSTLICTVLYIISHVIITEWDGRRVPVKKLLWASRQVFLRQKKLINHRAAQHAVKDAEFEDLVDFVDCLDECEQLPSVSVSAKDLVLL